MAVKAFSASQIQRILSAIFIHFDPARIPRDHDGDPRNQCSWKLVGALSTIIRNHIHDLKLPEWQRVVDQLIHQWPDLWKWMKFYERTAENHHLSVNIRASIKGLWILLADSFRGIPQLRAAHAFFKVSDIIPYVVRLWELELACLGLHPFHNGDTHPFCSAGQLLQTYLREADDTFLETFLRGDANRSVHLASLAIGHLLRDLKIQSPMQAGVACHLNMDIIRSFTLCPSVYHDLLAQGLANAVTKALLTFSTNTVAVDTVTSCVEYCFTCLLATFDTGNGATWIIQSLNAQLISAALRCSDSAFFDGRKNEHGIKTLLLKVLPRYLIYESVLIAAGRAVQKAQHLEETLDIAEPLRGFWTAFKADVWRGLTLASRCHPDGALDLRHGCSFENVSAFALDFISKFTFGWLVQQRCSANCTVYWLVSFHQHCEVAMCTI